MMSVFTGCRVHRQLVWMLCLTSALGQPQSPAEHAASWCHLRQYLCVLDWYNFHSEQDLGTSISSTRAGMFSWNEASSSYQMSPSSSGCISSDVTTCRCFPGLVMIPQRSDSRVVCGKPNLLVYCKQFAAFGLIRPDGFYPKQTQQCLRECFHQQKEGSSRWTLTSVALQCVKGMSFCNLNGGDRESQPGFHPLDCAVL